MGVALGRCILRAMIAELTLLNRAGWIHAKNPRASSELVPFGF